MNLTALSPTGWTLFVLAMLYLAWQWRRGIWREN